MSNQIHGHAIIDRISEYSGGISRAEFSALVAKEFGAGARFCTCSAENMDLPALLEFLKARDKVREQDGMLYPGGSPACSH